MSYIAAQNVFSVFSDLYFAAGSHKKKLHRDHLVTILNLSKKRAGEFLKEATDLCVIDRINANEFTHNNKFIKMIQAKRYADEAQKDFLSQHDMYREVILRFGNTVPTHEQLERFFKSYGHEPKTDSTTRKIISSISKSLRELEAINMLNFDLDLLRGAEKPKDVDRNGGQRGKNRGKNKNKNKDTNNNNNNNSKPADWTDSNPNHPPAPDFSVIDDEVDTGTTKPRGKYDEYPHYIREELEAIDAEVEKQRQRKMNAIEMQRQWGAIEEDADARIADLRRQEAIIKHNYEKSLKQ